MAKKTKKSEELLSGRAYGRAVGVNQSVPSVWRQRAGLPVGKYSREAWARMRALHDRSLPSPDKEVTSIEASEERSHKTVAKQLKKVEAELGDRQRLESAVLSQVEHLNAPEIRYVPKTRTSLSPATPVLMIGDLHAGHAEAPLKKVEARLTLLRQSFGHWITGQRSIYTCEDCHVFLMGDYVEGALRASARQTNAEQEPQQALGVGNLLGAFLNDLTSQFTRVYATMILVDNHARLDEKMNFEQAIERSWNPIVEAIIRGRCEANDAITLDAPRDFAACVKVENTRFLLIHGNGIRMMRRTPFYGIEDRLALEKAVRQGTETEFDILCLAHFHHIGEGQSWFMNPSLIGTTGYDKATGRETCSAQTAFLVSPKHIRPFCKITFSLGGE